MHRFRSRISSQQGELTIVNHGYSWRAARISTPEKLERPALRHSLSSAKRRCSSTPTTARPEADHPGRSGGGVWPKLAPCPRGEPLTPVSPQADADADPTAMAARPIAVSCCPRWTGAGTLTGTAAEAPAEYEHQRDQVQVTRRAAEQRRRAV
jgi:hypothetical protein